jgi:hypothetical protein
VQTPLLQVPEQLPQDVPQPFGTGPHFLVPQLGVQMLSSHIPPLQVWVEGLQLPQDVPQTGSSPHSIPEQSGVQSDISQYPLAQISVEGLQLPQSWPQLGSGPHSISEQSEIQPEYSQIPPLQNSSPAQLPQLLLTPHITLFPQLNPKLEQVSVQVVTHFPAELQVCPFEQLPQLLLTPQTVRIPQLNPKLEQVSVQVVTHSPKELQDWPFKQVPQNFVVPQTVWYPHSYSKAEQVSVQVETHFPKELQTLLPVQFPQLPPQPFEPHIFPAQLGMQTETHSPVAVLQVCPFEQLPQLATALNAPQLSKAVAPPQALFNLEQNAEFVSGVHVQTFDWQVFGNVQLPQFKVPPQPLLILPQFLPCAEQVVGIQGATHKPVLNVHISVHLSVPVYPAPKTPAQVAPPKEELSHLSVPSLIPFPQKEEAKQLLSFVILHPEGQ